jgi:hypothetical protein
MNTNDPRPASLAAAHGYAAGDAVEICDHSEAHGDKGKVLWKQKDGLIIVELESGCCWPVTAEELKSPNDQAHLPAPAGKVERKQNDQ